MARDDWKRHSGVYDPYDSTGIPDEEPLTSTLEPWVWFSRVPAAITPPKAQGKKKIIRIWVQLQIAWDKGNVPHMVGIRTPGTPMTEELLRALPLRELVKEAAWLLSPRPKPPDWHADINLFADPAPPKPEPDLRSRDKGIRNLWQLVTPDIGEYRDDPRSTAYLERVALLSREAQRAGLPMNLVVGFASNSDETAAYHLGEKHRRWAREAGFDTGHTRQNPKTTRKGGGTQKGTT